MASKTEQSPFASLTQDDVEKILTSSPSLGESLRRILQDPNIIFCKDHPDQDVASQAAWRLHAALLNKMLLPLARIFKRASDAAIEALESTGSTELELAFRSSARDAYVWLQSMLSDDLSWCTTIGCPTCSVTHILSSESTIRAVLTTAILSPPFTPIIKTLHQALSTDPFWTPNHFPHIHARATTLASNLRSLIQKTTEMEIILSSPPGSDSSWSSDFSSSSMSWAEQRERDVDRTLIGVKASKLAKRQIALKEEECAMEYGMVRRFVEGERVRDTRMLAEKRKVRRKKSGGGLSRNKSSSSLLRFF